MKEKKSRTLFVWIFCMALATLPAFWMPVDSIAARGEEAGFHNREHRGGFRRVFKMLNLTDDQKRDVAVILKERRDQRRELHQQMKEARKNLFTVIGSADYNEAAVRQASREVSRIQEELTVLRAQTHHQVRAILTPDQQAKMDTMRERFGDRMQKRMHRFDRFDRWIDRHAG